MTKTQLLHRIKRVRKMLRCNGVLEGGGVKGIGHVGAVHALEQAGYRFERVAGSSAGAIVAALIAADYHGEEMAQLMKSLDYMKFKQTDLLDRLGTEGKQCMAHQSVIEYVSKKYRYYTLYVYHSGRFLSQCRFCHDSIHAVVDSLIITVIRKTDPSHY